MTRQFAQTGLRQRSHSRLRPKANVLLPFIELLEDRQMLDAGGGSQPLPATIVAGHTPSSYFAEGIQITYSDDVAVNRESIWGASVEVQPPVGRPLNVYPVSVTPSGTADSLGDAPKETATYQLTPPGGSWGTAPAGSYAITLAGAPVTDLAGNSLRSSSLGAFLVQNGASQQIVITQPPSFSGLVGIVFVGIPFSVTATMEDLQGHVLASFDGSMTIALAANPGGATLGGTLTATASGGVAIFSGLSLDQPGTGYVLQVSGAGLESSTAPFIVDVNRTITIGGPKLMPAVILVQGLKKKGAIDKILLTFDSPMDRASVTDLHNYDLRNLGRDPQFPYPKGRRVRLLRAADHPATDSIMLTLEKPVTIKDTLSLSLNAKPPSGLRDPNGRYLENAFGPFQVPLMKIYILPYIE